MDKTAPAPADRWNRDHLVRWDFGDVPEQVDFGRAGWPIVNYPALVDCGADVALRLFADAADARASHEAGVVRLILLALDRGAAPGHSPKQNVRSFAELDLPPSAPSPVAATALPSVALAKEGGRGPRPAAAATAGISRLAPATFPRPILQFLKESEIEPADLSADLVRAAVRQAFLADRPPVRSADEFHRRLDTCHAALGPAHAELGKRIGAILHEAAALQSAIHRTSAPLPPATRDDLAAQLAWLIFPGFVATVPWPALASYPRFLEAMRMRIERSRLNPAGDTRKLDEFAPHWQRYETFVGLDPKPTHDRAALQEYRWLLEEFRISLFAQELKTLAPVSGKRLDALWQKATGK